MLYFDTCLLPLIWNHSFPCHFSGIYFRPTFHYATFTNGQTLHPPKKPKLQQWREKFTLKRALSSPNLHTLFSLDAFSINPIQQLKAPGSTASVIHLADPVSIDNHEVPPIALRQSLNIDSHRQVFLVFGALTERKGIFQLLEAVSLLTKEAGHQICILFIGEASPQVQTRLRAQIETITKSHPIQIIHKFDYIPESEVSSYFKLADVVLAPYQQHVGMSGILIQAAAARKPVLSSDYGLMGEVVSKHQLGITVDSTQPADIALGLKQFIETPYNQLYNAQLSYEFAQSNSSENFARTIWNSLLSA